ncbi:MAG TPA: hypothetical protein VG164_04775, partial [Trebonia sp.]|nr:hypothetical protein [Trebonia sp.]
MPWTQELVPPEVLTGAPLDCCGLLDGDCRLLELLLEELLLEEPLLLEELLLEEPLLLEELLLEEPLPLPDEPLLDDFDEVPAEPADPDFPVDADPVPCTDPEPCADPVLVAARVAPGSMTAITPAAAKLATPTPVVVVFSRRRPCSRSATAVCRARGSWLLMSAILRN